VLGFRRPPWSRTGEPFLAMVFIFFPLRPFGRFFSQPFGSVLVPAYAHELLQGQVPMAPSWCFSTEFLQVSSPCTSPLIVGRGCKPGLVTLWPVVF